MRRIAGHAPATFALAFVALGSAACGGGPATLHPAHVVPRDTVVLGAGVSSSFALGDVEAKIDRGRSLSAGTTTSGADQAFADAAVASALVRTGVSPWAGGRLGLGYDSEALLTYTGGSLRGGGRYAWQGEHWALGLGAGASAHLLRAGSQKPDEFPEATAGRFEGSATEQGATGFGLDVPLVGGYRSAGDILAIWAGTRIGFDRGFGALSLVPATASDGTPLAQRANLSATRWYAGGLVGLAVGVEPLWVGVQLDAIYQSVSGSIETDDTVDPLQYDVDADGVGLTPTGVVWGKF